MKGFLMVIGGLTLMVIAGTAIIFGISAVQYAIGNIKYTFKIKHRFDKPPTARCYCIDCKYHCTDGKCVEGFTSRYMGDSWFCCFATPKESEQR